MTQETKTGDYKKAIARIYQGNGVIGAGFLVPGGYLLTCAHVVRQALRLQAPTCPGKGSRIKVNFPFVSLKGRIRAELLLYRYVRDAEAFNEDIAGLRLLDDLPEGVQPVLPRLGYDTHSPFRMVGFPQGHSKGIAATGQFVEELAGGWVQLEDPKQQGYEILPGFSGTPVWDETVSAVVGMAVARVKDEAQPNAKTGFMVPGKQLIEVQRELQVLGLGRLLEEQGDELNEAIAQAFQLCCPSSWSQSAPANLEKTLAQLQEIPRGDSRYEVIDRFAALLTRPEINIDGGSREGIEQWLLSRIKDYQALKDEVQFLLPKPEVEAQPIQSHLLIYVEDGSEASRSVLALFIPEAAEYESRSAQGCDRLKAPGWPEFGEKVTLETLPAMLRACLAEVAPRSKQITVELILPFAWLHQDCDRWSETDSSDVMALLGLDIPKLSLGADRPVILRIAERLNPAIPALYRQKWESKWEALQQLNPYEMCSAFVSGDELSIRQQLPGELNKSCHVGLTLSTCCDEAEHPILFGTLIATGTPAALWLRQDQFNQTVVAADEMNALLNCKIATLPEAVKRCRSDAMGKDEDAHIGHHLAFLWEDPNLVPPGTDNRNAMSLGMPQPS